MDEKLDIETSSVSGASTNFDGPKSAANSLSSKVSGYDTAPDKQGVVPFNVEIGGATSLIGNNMQICSNRIDNIKKALNNVVETHEGLQVNLDAKFPKPKGMDAEEETPGDGNGGNISGGLNNGGAGAGAGAAGAAGAGAAGAIKDASTKKDKKEKKGPVETELTDVGYVYADEDNLTAESLELLSDPNFRYDDNGFARIGDRYLVACDYSVGEIGDVLRFTQKTGEPIECVIGVNTFSDKYKHTLNFVVNENAVPITPTKTTESIIENNLFVDNLGNYTEAGSYEEKSVDGLYDAATTGTFV